MPNWLLPLLCLIVLLGFIYVGFWKGLNNRRDDNPDNWTSSGGGGGPTDGHQG